VTLRILLVDDNPTFLASVRQFFQFLPDAQVIGDAHDGLSALDAANRLQPDLVLLDIAMPGMNGLDVARALKSWAHPPKIVFLSMYDGEIYRGASRELGALGFVSKADFVTELLPLVTLLAASTAAEQAEKLLASRAPAFNTQAADCNREV
jgi:DNA-binding NarL/FixJ family response regulator